VLGCSAFRNQLHPHPSLSQFAACKVCRGFPFQPSASRPDRDAAVVCNELLCGGEHGFVVWREAVDAGNGRDAAVSAEDGRARALPAFASALVAGGDARVVELMAGQPHDSGERLADEDFGRVCAPERPRLNRPRERAGTARAGRAGWRSLLPRCRRFGGRAGCRERGRGGSALRRFWGRGWWCVHRKGKALPRRCGRAEEEEGLGDLLRVGNNGGTVGACKDSLTDSAELAMLLDGSLEADGVADLAGEIVGD